MYKWTGTERRNMPWKRNSEEGAWCYGSVRPYRTAVSGMRRQSMKHAAMPRHGTGLAWRSLAVGNQWERRWDTQRRGKREGGGKWEGQLDVSSGRISSALSLGRRRRGRHRPASCHTAWTCGLDVGMASFRERSWRAAVTFLACPMSTIHSAFPRLTFECTSFLPPLPPARPLLRVTDLFPVLAVCYAFILA